MTIYGSDVSHYDLADTRLMFSEGIVFQTHKAGGDANDPELAAWWKMAEPYRDRVLLGAYWVQYPGNPVGRADSFIARLDSQCPDWRDAPFILQTDCEKWGGDASTVPSVADVNAFCDRLAERAPKLRAIGYLPDWVYGDLSKFRYPLWSSKYVTGTGTFRELYPGDNSSKWAAYGGKTPAILQYSSSATIGGQTTCDANAFRGTLKELTGLLAPGWIEREEPNVPITPQEVANIATAAAAAVWGYKLDVDVSQEGTNLQPAGGILRYTSTEHHQMIERTDTIINRTNAILLAISQLDGVDEQAIIAGVLAGLSPEAIAGAIAAALPADIAAQVANELASRLQS